MDIVVIASIFLAIAFLYSSAGFGGGSSYLAILALFGTAFIETRFIALACNIAVVAGSSYLFILNRLINWKKVLPLIVLSIPMAYIGGMIRISEESFFIILGFTLVVAGPVMVLQSGSKKGGKRYSNQYLNAMIGGAIGLLSGMVGIGGGIFLAPVLHLVKWDQPKKIAATASLYILVNSIAGMLGQMSNNHFNVNLQLLFACLGAVIIGGQLGVRISIRNLSPVHLKWVTAVLVVFVGIKILIGYMS